MLACMGALSSRPAVAQTAAADVQTVWRLLDYIAVDYEGAVSKGKVISAAEYAEMTEFAGTVRRGIRDLPETPARAPLAKAAGDIEASIAAKDEPAIVAARSRQLASRLLAAYPVPLAPRSIPDLAKGAKLYSENCTSCHGANGNGQGPLARGMTPPPIAFTDRERARQRSLFALYQVIDQGLEGTAMPSFAQMSDEDRWALAFYVGGFAFNDRETGEEIWKANTNLRQQLPNLETLAGMTPAALARTQGDAKADAVIAHLRAHPEALNAGGSASLSVARAKLDASLLAYQRGNRPAAQRLALSAYLDGFEPVEPILSARDSALMVKIEAAMIAYRAAIASSASVADVEAKANAIDTLFSEAETVLSPEMSSGTSAFLGALAILLREGVEALLIVVAMIAFLKKAERPQYLRYVHGGWIAALVAGVATWAVATYLVSISGAGREMTEGVGSLVAAVILVSVGIWMHGKSSAAAWQRYVREVMDKALSRGSVWFLCGLSFLVVYREVFETVLFFSALVSQGNGDAVAAGALTAIVLLAAITWVMLKLSRSLPIGKFFAYSSVLIAILAVVLAGKGVAALQEAGAIDIAPLATIPRIPMLGLFPTWESFGAQLLATMIIAAGIWYNGRRASQLAAT
ncbi:MAG TPA: cytochrome c/FTR1 family iron permease [Sphingorhabdus sp.]|nr:cytochrome c/FTR1 family iron permease [Sphingorhabdus sp.]